MFVAEFAVKRFSLYTSSSYCLPRFTFCMYPSSVASTSPFQPQPIRSSKYHVRKIRLWPSQQTCTFITLHITQSATLFIALCFISGCWSTIIAQTGCRRVRSLVRNARQCVPTTNHRLGYQQWRRLVKGFEKGGVVIHWVAPTLGRFSQHSCDNVECRNGCFLTRNKIIEWACGHAVSDVALGCE